MKTVINNEVYITKEDYNNTHKDFKGKIDNKENILAPVIFILDYKHIL